MSNTAVYVINGGYALVFAGLAVAVIRVCRTPRRPSEQERAAAAVARLGPLSGPGLTAEPEVPVPAAPDNRPGIHLADHDECELIWSMPAVDLDLEAGCALLWQAVRDEQHKQKGEQ
jgi:hypothetical protein